MYLGDAVSPKSLYSGIRTCKILPQFKRLTFNKQVHYYQIAYKEKVIGNVPYVLLIWQVVKQLLLCREFAQLLPVLTFCSPDQGASITFHQTYKNVVTMKFLFDSCIVFKAKIVRRNKLTLKPANLVFCTELVHKITNEILKFKLTPICSISYTRVRT